MTLQADRPQAPTVPVAHNGNRAPGGTHPSPATDAPAAAPAAQPAAPTPQPAAAPVGRGRPRFLSRKVVLPVLAVLLVAGAAFGYNSYREGVMYVSTDNAQLTGQPVQVGSMNAGRVEAIRPAIGASVRKGDILAQVSLPSQVGTGQKGQPKLAFLGGSDSRVDVEAPFDGIVIAEPVAVGATVAAGQAIVTLVDPSQLWVNANIEETHIGRVRVGQPVSVHVDALNSDVPGKVLSVTPATAATFSLIPTSNTSGNFTKVTQLVPVRIGVNLGNQPMLLGANVEVKIRVAD